MEILNRKVLSDNSVSTTYKTSKNKIVEVTSTFGTAKSLAEVLLSTLQAEIVAKAGILE